MNKKRNPHLGSSLDSFLDEIGIREQAEYYGMKSALAWQFKQAMKKQKMSKASVAAKLKTSRSQLERMLDPHYTGTTLHSILQAAEVLGLRLGLNLVEESPRKPQRRAA